MGEVANLNQIVAEIKFFENQAVVSYWEIGKRLSQAKEQVGHGNWYSWIDENLGYTPETARKLMKISNEISNPNTYCDLSFSKVLALTSIKDEEARQDFIDKHEVEDMTTRQLQAEIKKYKKSLEETENELKAAKAGLEFKDGQIERYSTESSRLSAQLELAKMNRTKPQIVEKEVIKEVIPDDYEDLKEQQKDLLKIQKELQEELYKEQKKTKEVVPKDYDDLKFKAKDLDKAYEEIKRKNMEIASLKSKERENLAKLEEYDANKKIINDLKDFMWTIDSFIRRIGGLIYLTDYYNELPNKEKEYFNKSVDRIYDWSGQLKENLKQIKNKEK